MKINFKYKIIHFPGLFLHTNRPQCDCFLKKYFSSIVQEVGEGEEK